jgi:hydrogenase maturation protein HypF
LISRIAPAVAPGIATLGIMLPYTPLHELLLAEFGGPLVMTSGNLSDEPLAFRDDEARERLGHIADHFLTHNRPIHLGCAPGRKSRSQTSARSLEGHPAASWGV